MATLISRAARREHSGWPLVVLAGHVSDLGCWSADRFGDNPAGLGAGYPLPCPGDPLFPVASGVWLGSWESEG
jgi:hypothetical protein